MGIFHRLRSGAMRAPDRCFCCRHSGYNVIPGKQGGRQRGLGGGSEPISAPRRPRAQSGRDRSRLRQAGKGRLCSGHRGARQGDLDPPRRQRPDRPGKRSNSCRMRKTRCRAPSGVCWRSAKTIPSSNRTQNFLRAAIPARGDGKPDRRRPPRLHRFGAGL